MLHFMKTTKKDNIHRYILVDLFYLNDLPFYRVITWYSFRKGHEYLLPAEKFHYSLTNKDLDPYKVSNILISCFI